MTTEDAQPAPETSPDEPVLAGAPSQMLARLLMGVILFGVVVSGAYIATRRSVTPAVSVAAAPAQIVTQPKPQVVVAVAVPVAAPGATITPEETRGHTFLQVGAVEASAAPQFVRELSAKGFTARIAEGPQPSVARILIGPLAGPEIKSMQAKLTAAAVAAFPKAY